MNSSIQRNAILLFLLGILTILSCNRRAVLPADNKDTNIIVLHEGEWYFNFKQEVFMRCLKKIYPVDFSNLMDSLDGSIAANLERLRYEKEVLDIADSLAQAFFKRPEASYSIENRRITFNACLYYRNSPELDALAVRYYKKFYQKRH